MAKPGHNPHVNMDANAPYYLESIQEIMLTVLYTARVKGAVPVSVLLCAESGTAKTKMLQAITGICIHPTDSFTSNGLFDIMRNDQQNKLRWIVTPDLNPTLSRRPATVNATVSNLLTLTMDGTCRVDDGRAEKVAKHEPIGFLSGVTPDIYNKQAKKWLSLGLRRRIIPLFYEYTAETEEKLKLQLREDKISGAPFPEMRFDDGTKVKPHIDTMMAMEIELRGVMFANNLGVSRFRDREGTVKWFVKKIVPISPITTLRTLARAHAIKDKRGQVEQKDISFLSMFLDFTNPSMPKQI